MAGEKDYRLASCLPFTLCGRPTITRVMQCGLAGWLAYCLSIWLPDWLAVSIYLADWLDGWMEGCLSVYLAD